MENNYDEEEAKFANEMIEAYKNVTGEMPSSLSILASIQKEIDCTDVWFAVDEDGTECQFNSKPVQVTGQWMIRHGKAKEIESGTIEKLIGHKLTCNDAPYKYGENMDDMWDPDD